tara:strand:- start:200 stop:385 length:186 start_codon:yes stop_codon:yes gene_type:complete
MAGYQTEQFMAKNGKSYTLLVLNPEGKYPFSFGLQKASLILDNLDQIKEFVSDNEEEQKSW